jgi:hypothetical protein
LSGEALDGMAKWAGMALEAPERSGALSVWGPTVVQLCDALSSGWKQRQAKVLAEAIRDSQLIHEEIGRRLTPRVSRQAVTKALAGARWHALEAAIDAFEAHAT